MTIRNERDKKPKRKKYPAKKQFNPIIWKANNTYAWKRINFVFIRVFLVFFSSHNEFFHKSEQDE